MATNLNLYDVFRQKQSGGNGAVNLTAVTTKMMIVSAGYVPNQNTHAFRDSLGANEVVGAGYATGGNILSTVTVVLSALGVVTVDANDPASWVQTVGGFTNGRRIVIYVARGGAATADELIAYSDDFGADLGNVAATLTLTLNALGIFTSGR